MLKFNRNFKAVFEIGERKKSTAELIAKEKITISYPFTVSFNVDTGVYSTSNNGQFQFYNLNPQDRAKLWLDIGAYGNKYVKLDFYAGYNDTMPLIFSGFIMECTSNREAGSTEWVTNVQGLSAFNFFQYGFINATFTKGTTLTDILRYATEGTELKVGYITPDIPPLSMNKTFIGQTIDILGREYGQYNVFVQNNELNILGENDVIPGEIEVITDSTGLLGSPRRANLFTEVDLIFTPNIRAGQAVSLLSRHEAMKQFNRAYEVVKVQHQGIISPSVSGKLTTKLILSMFASDPEKEVKTVEKAPEATYQPPPKKTEWQKPVKYTRVSSPFGWRIHPTKKVKKFHSGIDLAAAKNTPVYAAADGRVEFVGWGGDYGKIVKIEHGKQNGKVIRSLYAHLNDNSIVKPNTQVVKGQLIGKVGTTGVSTGYHLHFEITQNGTPVNPVQYINF